LIPSDSLSICPILQENGGKGQIILPSTHVHAMSEGQITLDGEGVDLTIKSSNSFGETDSKAIISGGMQDSRFIYLAHKNSFLRLENLVVSEFQSLWGGAVYVRDGTLVATKCTFDSSTSYYYGAALVIHGGYSKIIDSRFLSNFAGRGGAVYQNGGYLHVEESEFLGNIARFYGGGIYAKAGVLRMESNRFDQNRAMDDGKGNSVYNTDAMLDWICPANQYLFDHPGMTVVNKDLNVADYCTLAIIHVNSYEDSVDGSCTTVDVDADQSSTSDGSDAAMTCNLRAAVMLAMEVGGGEVLVPTAQDHIITEGLLQLDGVADVTITPYYNEGTNSNAAKQSLPSSYAQDFNLLYDNGERFLKSPQDYVRILGTNNTEKLFYVSGSEMHLHMERIVFDGFSSTRHGGVVYARRGTVSAYDCLFINNYASRGGAVYLYQGIIKISHSIFVSNQAQYGGAIYLRDGAFQIILSSLLNNQAEYGEGNSVYLNSGQLLWDCGDNFEMYALPESSEDLNGDIFTEDYCADFYAVANINSSTRYGEMFVVVYVSSQTPDSLNGACTTDDVEYRMNVPNPSTIEERDFFTSGVKVKDTFDLTGPGQSTCNLRAAVDLVELFGSGTVVLVSDDTYWITEGEINVDTAVHLAITSRSSTQVATLDGTHNKGERLLYVNHEDAEILLDDLLIEKFRSDAGSVVYIYDGKITISDSVLSENEASSNGGVAYLRSGTFVADDTLFQNNFATFNGGSVYLEGGLFTADTCWFDSNSADVYGGAVYVRDGTFETVGSGFLTNLARVEGTSVYNHAGSVDWLCTPDSDEKQQVLWNPNDNDYHKFDGDLSATEYCAGESGESSWKVNHQTVALSRWESNIEKQLKMRASQQQGKAQLEEQRNRYNYKTRNGNDDADDWVVSETMVIVEVTEYADSLTGSCTVMAECQDQACAESLRTIALEDRAIVQDDSEQFRALRSIEGIAFNDFHALNKDDNSGSFAANAACNLRAAVHLVQALGQGIILLPTAYTHHMVEGQILIDSAAEMYILPTFEGNTGSQAFMAEIDGSGNNARFLQVNHQDAFLNMEAVTVKNFRSDYSGAGVYIRHGNLMMRDCVMADNHALYAGGSVYIWEGSFTATTCVFSANSAAFGGALFVRDGTFNAQKECAFYGNTATAGNGHSIFTKQETRIRVTCHPGRSVLDSGLYNKFVHLIAEERQHKDVAEFVMEGKQCEMARRVDKGRGRGEGLRRSFFDVVFINYIETPKSNPKPKCACSLYVGASSLCSDVSHFRLIARSYERGSFT
jgi:predicted outer membrane repeat protein